MTAFTQKRFTVGATSPDAQKKYSESWDRIFGKKKETEETDREIEKADSNESEK